MTFECQFDRTLARTPWRWCSSAPRPRTATRSPTLPRMPSRVSTHGRRATGDRNSTARKARHDLQGRRLSRMREYRLSIFDSTSGDRRSQSFTRPRAAPEKPLDHQDPSIRDKPPILTQELESEGGSPGGGSPEGGSLGGGSLGGGDSAAGSEGGGSGAGGIPVPCPCASNCCCFCCCWSRTRCWYCENVF